MATFAVIYDSCVLHPNLLRDLLVQLATTDLIRARWTNQIHEEWIGSILRKHPELPREKLERTRDLMNSSVRDCLVAGYEFLIPSLSLPDPDDRHVLAAAIRCGAAAVVTFNERDFPKDALSPYNIEAIHPDDFILDLIDLHENTVFAAAKAARARFKNPALSIDEYLRRLVTCGLTETVRVLEEFADLL